MSQPLPDPSSVVPQTLSYVTPGRGGTCPICTTRHPSTKTIYGHPVCKKCFYRFANRRQGGYLIDAILYTLVTIPVAMATGLATERLAIDPIMAQVVFYVVTAPLALLFALKDGFTGYSPGKYLCGVQVLDDRTQQPIGFVQSFRRNAVLLVSLIPLVGGLVQLVIILIIAFTCGKGYRIGDPFARTRVIWKKFAHTPVFNRDLNVCTGCGYDLRGNLSGICPECGKPTPTRAAHEAIPVATAVGGA